MPVLYVVGGGLFGSAAAAFARAKGIEAVVFDAALDGAASPAAAGLFTERWLGGRLREHYRPALALLDRLYGVRSIPLARDDGARESLLFVPPAAVLEANPIRSLATAVGDGWVEAGGRRHEGWVYLAAGVWCGQLAPRLDVHGRAGAAFVFPGEREGRTRLVARGRQAVAFVRDPGTTYFSDGTAERDYTPDHDRQSLERAAGLGLTGLAQRLWGRRPYTPGGPVFRKLGARTWLAAGGRKVGLVLGASFARRLVEDELGL
jgi:hypothetical protein